MDAHFYFMPKLVNLVGQVFHNLTVIESEIRYNNDQRRLWLCLCTCGNTLWKTRKALLKCPYNFCGYNTHPTKICTKCKIDKDKETGYHKSNARENNIQPVCKECKRKEYNPEQFKKKYNEQMADPEKKKHKYAVNNKSRWKPESIAKQKIRKLEYNKRPEVIERRKQIHRIRKANDIQYALTKRLRCSVRDIVRSLKNKKYKYKQTMQLLGCDIDFFKKHIEDKFVDGMCWENFSLWHIDHIKPLSRFDLTDIEEQNKACHYTNLQPLWWRDNIVKGNKYDEPNPN